MSALNKPLNYHGPVTIDGFAGTGTSTTAKLVAQQLGWAWFSAGDHLRTGTLAAIRRGLMPGGQVDVPACEKLAARLVISADGEGRYCLDGEDVSGVIHSAEVTAGVALFAQLATVRACHDADMVAFAAAHSNRVVYEGRVTGLTFPGAIKFWLTADPQVTHDRVASGRSPEVAAFNAVRDELDSLRPVAPVRPADDAFVIDTSGLKTDGAARIILERLGQP